MPVTLINTLSSESANSYCSLDYASDYFTNHFNTAKSTTWAAFTSSQQIQALISACWTLEQLRFTIPQDYSHLARGILNYNTYSGSFYGYSNNKLIPAKYNIFQALQFPRNKDVLSNGTTFIPDRVMMAQCEQAIYLANYDESAATNVMQGIVLDKTGLGNGAVEITQEYNSSASPTTLAPIAVDLIKPFLVYNTSISRG